MRQLAQALVAGALSAVLAYGCGSDSSDSPPPAGNGGSGAVDGGGAAGTAGLAGKGGSGGTTQGGSAGAGGAVGGAAGVAGSTGGSAGTAGSTGGAAGALGGAAGSSGEAGTAGASGTAGAAGSSPSVPCAAGTEITTLPACTALPSLDALDVVAGCTPNVDGILHDEEWKDGTCFNLGGAGAGVDLILTIKYAGSDVYLALSGKPTCGCPMWLGFDPSGAGAEDGDEFAIGVFDDPFDTTGDRAEATLKNGAWVAGPGSAPAGIVALCPPNTPDPVRYEWKIPFSALKIAAGTAHTFRMSVTHAPNTWPLGVPVDAVTRPLDPSKWGKLSSSLQWK